MDFLALRRSLDSQLVPAQHPGLDSASSSIKVYPCPRHCFGSPSNALEWAPAETLSEIFVKGIMDGLFTGPQSVDFLRGACLHQYDGVWMDVGIFLIRRLEKFCWKQLEDPNSPHPCLNVLAP